MEGFEHLKFQKQWGITPKTQYQLGQCDALVSAICEMPLRPEYYKRLLLVALTKGAQATTAIEGNTLTDKEVEDVAEGKSLPQSKEYQEIEVKNILDAMNSLRIEVAIEKQAKVITPEMIKRFHKLIGKDLGQHFDAIPGHFRTDARIVGRYHCPPHEKVPELVDLLCKWLSNEFSFSKGQRQPFAEAVIQAIVTQVYIQWIHPFGDGNGRTGRLLEFYILLRAGNPDMASHILSNFYNQTRPEYYRQLGNATKARDLTEFIGYAVQGFKDGLTQTLETIQESEFITAWRDFIYDKFAESKYRKKSVFKRRRELILRMPLHEAKTLTDLSVLTPQIAREYANHSLRTLTRDLELLKEMDLITISTDGKYMANSDILRRHMARRLKN